MEQDIIDSDNTDYVMSRIRELYLKDSTVTIVLIGKLHGHAVMLIGRYKHHFDMERLLRQMVC